MVGMFLALAAGAALAAGPVAQPSTTIENQSVTVSYADLDLGTPAGQRVLKKRVYTAAAHICGIDDYETALPDLQEVTGCSAQIASKFRPVVLTTIAQGIAGHASVAAAAGIIGK